MNSQLPTTNYIEHYFSGNPNFNVTSTVLILCNGDSFDTVYFKINLPELPTGISYRGAMIYDLVQEIKLVVGGKVVYYVDSKLMKFTDKINGNITRVEYLSKIRNNSVCYPLYLNQALRESESLTNSETKHSKGIKFYGLDMHEVRLVVRFGELKDIIVYPSDFDLDILKEKKYHMADASALIIYNNRDISNQCINLTSTIPRDEHAERRCSIIQPIEFWVKDEEFIGMANSFKIKIRTDYFNEVLYQPDNKTLKFDTYYEVTDLVVSMDNTELKDFKLQLNGFDLNEHSNSDIIDMHWKCENNLLLDPDISFGMKINIRIKKGDVLILCVNLKNPIDVPRNLTYYMKCRSKLYYYEGMSFPVISVTE